MISGTQLEVTRLRSQIGYVNDSLRAAAELRRLSLYLDQLCAVAGVVRDIKPPAPRRRKRPRSKPYRK